MALGARLIYECGGAAKRVLYRPWSFNAKFRDTARSSGQTKGMCLPQSSVIKSQ